MLLLLLLAQVQAAPLPQPTAQQPAEKPVCHMEQPEGSRIPVRICHSKAEWDQLERDSQDIFTSAMAKQGLGTQPAGK